MFSATSTEDIWNSLLNIWHFLYLILVTLLFSDLSSLSCNVECDSLLKQLDFFLLNVQHTEWPVAYAGVGTGLQIKSMSIESLESVKWQLIEHRLNRVTLPNKSVSVYTIYSLKQNFKFVHLSVEFYWKVCLPLIWKQLETFCIYLMENELQESDWMIPNVSIDLTAGRTLVFSPWLYLFCRSRQLYDK